MKKIKVKYRKLAKEKVYGWCHDDCIELDPRLKGKKHLEILIHESIHFTFPALSEEEVIAKSILITNTLWSENYRRTDNSNDTPLQDGSL